MKSRIRKFYIDSKLNFGKYRGETVQQVLDKDGGADYLLFCISKMKKITFDEDALTRINLAKQEDEEIYENDVTMDAVEAGWDGHKNWK